MQTHHWFLLLIVFAVGYGFARFFPQLGNAVGLPGGGG